MRALLHALALVIFTSMIPALLGVSVRRAMPCLFVVTTFAKPVPVNRTATPCTGVRERVTLASTTCALPLAFTIPGVTLSTRQMFRIGFGFGFGFA